MNALQSLTTIRFPDPSPKSRLERFLAHLADVRGGEGAGVLLLALNLFLLLGAYYLLKTVREVLILSQGGAEVKSYSAAGQAILLLVVVPLFGAIASRVSRVRLVTGVTLFFVSNLAIFAVLGKLGYREGENLIWDYRSAKGHADRPLSDNAITAALRRMGYTGDQMSWHGFRAMASTLLNELGFSPDIIELQLAHQERNEVRAAYNRAQRLDERRKMMQAWADYLDGLCAGSNVALFRRSTL